MELLERKIYCERIYIDDDAKDFYWIIKTKFVGNQILNCTKYT